MNNVTVKENKVLGEKHYSFIHKSGLEVFVFPKNMTTSYAIFATRYGAVDNKFKEKGEFYVIPVFEEVSRVEKMILSNEFVTLNTTTNTGVTLTATVPGQTSPVIEWVSSNPAVATVENGVVTAVGEGSTMITAICGGMSATCLITVEGETGIEGTELKSGNIDLIWNGYTITDSRKEKVNFTQSYLDNKQIIVTMAGSDIATKAAKAIGIDIYGGDCIINRNGKISLIDLNDFPSFSAVREEAAKEIAGFIMKSK